VGDDGGTFAALNFEPDRPEAEIMREYVAAWDYLYDPGRYLARAYRYHLAMCPRRRPPALAPGSPRPGNRVADRTLARRRMLLDAKAFFKILWWQGVRRPYRRQFLTQLLGMCRRNPSRLAEYLLTCAMGEDLFDLRRVVRAKATAIMKERGLGAPPGPSGPGAAPAGPGPQASAA
jgi:hypothetical protein